MVKYTLDTTFSALADPTRRAIVARLAAGSLPTSDLAEPFDMTLPGVMKHLMVLEDAGLVEREKKGRVAWCRLSPEPMKSAVEWIGHYERFWDDRLDALASYLSRSRS